MRGSDWTPKELIKFVDKIAKLHDLGKIPYGLHLPGGNEQNLIDIFSEIDEHDYVFSTHRNMYHALLHGLPPIDVENNILNARSMFMFDKKRNFFVSAIIGGTVGIAAGVALALKKKKSGQKVWCFIGDGTEDNGNFAEAVRYVDSLDLPCTFIIEDNGTAAEASKISRWGKADNNIKWPKCVTRYYYKKTKPHIRTGNFAPIDEMRKSMRDPNVLFPPIPTETYKTKNYNSQLQISFKEAVEISMQNLGNNNAIFIGYSLLPGDAMGSLARVSDEQKIEMPVAENLMVGVGIGLSLEGYLPVIYFERHDFMLVAADAIVNHLDKIEKISLGQFKPKVILKTVVDNGGIFYSGPTHSQNFTEAFRKMIEFPVIVPNTAEEVIDAYNFALECKRSVMIVELKTLLTR